VVLTTRYLEEEAGRLAHRIAVIDHGRLVSVGTAEHPADPRDHGREARRGSRKGFNNY
jgi:ABC-type multidrug transport system ATPase subunit